MTNQNFPNVQSKEWIDLKERSIKLVEEFKSIREAYQEMYNDVHWDDLGGKRQPTIVRKLYQYPGDITPTMFISLIKDVESI